MSAQALQLDEKTSLLDQGDVNNSTESPHPQEVVPSKVVGEWLLRGVIGILLCFIAFKSLMPWLVVASVLVFRLCTLYAENDGDLGERLAS
mmetsp:Transcript_21148/g.34881  ORF Transcript_21148/g.34881 Transcript_21148/m.34881 type:complete len:91 (-) Transcript_21148:271-543(-)